MLKLHFVMHTTLFQSTRTEPSRWLELVVEQVAGLRFGVVQLTVHDAQVVQIERTEKFRLPPTSATASAER